MPTLLVLASSPLDQGPLRLGAEVKEIKEALQRSMHRGNWTIESNEAATVDDLRRALLDHKPAILHFCGHGGGDSGICFEDEEGETNSAVAEPLAKLLHNFKDTLKCVVLNACYSEAQAKIISREIDYVVGMRSAVGDDCARKFAVAFYDAIFADTSYRIAFNLGCSALDLNRLPSADAPIFMPAPHLAAPTLSYTSCVPEVESLLYRYFNTPFEQRAPLTTTGESLAPTLKRHYGEQWRRDIESVTVLDMTLISEDQWRVAAELRAGSIVQQNTCYVQIKQKSVLLEWEATVGLWSMPPKVFLATGSTEAVVARVTAEIDNYYTHELEEAVDLVQAVRLQTIDLKSLYGYVEIASEVGKRIIEILEDGNKHSLTLEIQSGFEDKSSVIVTKLLSESWIYKPSSKAS